VQLTPSAYLPVLPSERKRYGIFDELRKVQARFGYIPRAEMQEVAERHGIPVRDVHAVASFYPHFHLHPPKRADVAFCDDLTCHLNGSVALRAKVENQFGEAERKDISFRTVSCLGRCEGPPALRINDNYISGASADKVCGMIHRVIGGLPIGSTQPPVVGGKYKTDPYDSPNDRYSVFKKLLQTKDFQGVIDALKEGGIRGMGGAGFPASIKWDGTRKYPSKEKFIVCNADESEPGTLKDRAIMMEIPHIMIEGMMVAGVVCGAEHGWIYIRHEYEHATEILKEELAHCYKQGLLGKDIQGSGLNFDLEVFVSPGGYICGEVGALIEAMEGKRSEPRDKPPQLATHGFWMMPTLASNVETFALAVTVLGKGAEWFKAQGMNGGTGPKFIAITGHVNTPKALEVPMGLPYRDIIYKHGGGISGGRNLLAFAPSGPSSGFLPASMVDLPMEWNTLSKVNSMVGSSAVIAIAEGTCMIDMALNAVRFFRNESCGKCVPCRVGTSKMVDLITAWTQGKFSADQMPLFNELSDTMKTASICGLGQIAPVPMLSVIEHFPEQFEEHIKHHRCVGGVCFR
jgi:NADH:ubiquinone oxidoreductase subunit F (NADH-binding)/NADH:ubiquinone oxidoreductase subunit E